MRTTSLSAADVQILDGVAALLMRAGLDLAADAIYTVIYPESAITDDNPTNGEWIDLFE